jgi:hypothetical protein
MSALAMGVDVKAYAYENFRFCITGMVDYGLGTPPVRTEIDLCRGIVKS